ncbi:glutathione S-transferase family protein [Roseobacter sp.]|uniref:glutathione S-transferase family protein n=1 Tax=Roseobacter sp. TaxID=1907202 RepID=UPI00329A3D4A
MITLLTYPRAFGQYSGSPFCTKAAQFLKLSGVQWRREDMLDPRKMPFQKLPVIRTEGTLIADSDSIRSYLEAQGAQFDEGLSDIDKSTSRAFIRMAEEHIYFHVLLDRWGDDAMWPVLRDTYFQAIPWIMRNFVANSIRKTVLKGMHTQGLGRLSEQDRLARIEPDLDAVTTRLWQNRFLFGDKPTAADASVGPMISAAVARPNPSALSQRIKENAVLMGYVERIDGLLD